MTIVRNAAGNIVSFSYSDVLSLYRNGAAAAQNFDMQTFMNSSASSFVRPTSFAAFEEVSNYVRQTGQAITFDQYYTNQAIQLGKSGNDIAEYVKSKTLENIQRYFDGDFSPEGLFNKFVWGSTSYKIVGEVAPDGSGGTIYNGELRVFDEKFQFQEENKDGAIAVLTGLLGFWSDPFFQGKPFDMNFAGTGRQYANYDAIQANLDKVSTDNYSAQYSNNQTQSRQIGSPYFNELAAGAFSLVANIAADDPVFAVTSVLTSGGILSTYYYSLLIGAALEAGAKFVGIAELNMGSISVANASPSGLTVTGSWFDEHQWSNIQFNVDGTTTVNSSTGAVIELPSGVGQITQGADGAPILVIPGVNDGSDRNISFDQATGVVRIVAADQAVEFAPNSQVTVDPESRIAVTEFWNNEAKTFTQFNADLSRTIESYDRDNQQTWSREIAGVDSDGNPSFDIEINDNGTLGETQINGAAVTAAQIGGILGSNLGRVLGGNSVVGQVAAGTLIGAIGRQIGLSINSGWLSTDLTRIDPVTGNSVLLDSTNSGISQVDARFEAGLGQVAAGQLSSLLIGELAEALHLQGFERGLFQSVGTTITSQLVTNIYNVTVLGTNAQGAAYTLFDNFDAGALFGNISGAVGGFLGSTLAAQVVMPQTQAASIASSIASSIGAYLGSVFIPIPVLGTAIGSFFGSILGSLFGNLFGGDTPPHSGAYLWYDRASHSFGMGGSWVDHGGDPEIFFRIGNPQANVLNSLVRMTGGQVAAQSAPSLSYYQNGSTYSVYGVNYSWATSGGDLTPMVDGGMMSLIRGVDIEGGDILFRRAWENSQAGSASAFAADLQIAQDYRLYLDNAAVINALMAAEPESAFTTGWALTLLRARELGLDTASLKDFLGGIVTHLVDKGVLKGIEWAADFDRIAPDTLVLHNPNGPDVRVDNAFGPGLTNSVVGTDGNDVLNLETTPILYSVTHIAGGAGNDSITGSVGTDLIDGGAGDDIIHGGPGGNSQAVGDADWIFGGDGDDVLFGNGGDVVSGGAGNDTLHGGTGDWLVGGGGSDWIEAYGLSTVVSATVGSNSQNDVVRFLFPSYDDVNEIDEIGALYRSGGDLVSQNATLAIKDFFLTKSGVDRIEFADNAALIGSNLWRDYIPHATVTENLATDSGGHRHIEIDGLEAQPLDFRRHGVRCVRPDHWTGGIFRRRDIRGGAGRSARLQYQDRPPHQL